MSRVFLKKFKNFFLFLYIFSFIYKEDLPYYYIYIYYKGAYIDLLIKEAIYIFYKEATLYIALNVKFGGFAV